MLKILGVMFAGAIGTLIRYLLYGMVAPAGAGAIPAGTILVNVIGCFAIGWLIGVDPEKIHPDVKLYLIVGFCGALTTFSTFIAEMTNLLRSGDSWKAFLYIFVSVLAGFIVFRVGFLMSEKL